MRRSSTRGAKRAAVAILSLYACVASLAQAAILPTDLEAKVDADNQPTDADEHAIWQSLHQVEEAIRISPQRLIAPELDAYAHGVLERLIGRPAPELHIYLMRDASFNAAMFPSGVMIVNTGVLARVHSEAQFAAVLGHEVGHYFRKHSLDRNRDALYKSTMLGVMAAAGNVNGLRFGHGGPSWEPLNQANIAAVYKFSRYQESEADAYGIMLMARAGYSPRAASAICAQLIDERRASAAARDERYLDRSGFELSTHPASKRRVLDLADTADHLAVKGAAGDEGLDQWAAATRPYQAMLLREQLYRNDPGATLYLLAHRAKNGWTAELRFSEGEVYRLRNATGDDLKAAAAYAAATALPDAPPEAWRAHGYALLKAGSKLEADKALNRYLAEKPDAPDAPMIRFTLARGAGTGAGGSRLKLKPGSGWKRLPASMNQTRWEEVWTRNGAQLDRLTLIGGLPDGKAVINQEKSAHQKVPVFRADMTALDLASMVEVSYRVQGVAVFDFESVEPVDFLGGRGARLRYTYGSGIGFAKKGSFLMRVVDQKLYALKLEGVASPSFGLALAEFDQVVASARLSR
jgi:predicted Zn-dependent protease